MLIAALFIIAKLCKQSRCPTTDEWIKKMWYLDAMEFYLAMKKNEIWSLASKWMEQENIILSEHLLYVRFLVDPENQAVAQMSGPYLQADCSSMGGERSLISKLSTVRDEGQPSQTRKLKKSPYKVMSPTGT
jgi:hypothetical protein